MHANHKISCVIGQLGMYRHNSHTLWLAARTEPRLSLWILPATNLMVYVMVLDQTSNKQVTT